MPPRPHPRYQQAKQLARRCAVELCGRLLHLGSKPFQLGEAPAVVIAPHQDDETLGCGGIIARKRNEGLPVHIVFITDGAASHPHHARFDAAALSALRTREARQATAHLGVERGAVHFLNEPDGTLNTITPERRESLVAQLAHHLTAIQPGEIFLPCYPDGSSEHDATFGFAIDAIGRAGLRPAIWQYPIWSWWNPLRLVRRWLASDECRRMPAGDFQQAKEDAMNCYQSQLAPLAPETVPALPVDLVRVFRTETEYFFRHRLPAEPESSGI